ncbi:non-ribosomal peptide synthetase [Chitinophaga rhizophila]|uniref:Amino acid adenylation domain-containing protein n=1 Tax=Chitinophaga rhizophila TaxID=2866212 RepID=A0ABS7G860_9BACT|nr:non-ribosomal peptide synthetase [Chitinophaga rhizophila]MBW8683315.1 amino acid adenylation domain-containing protein [Chitinophaga rhizophila]
MSEFNLARVVRLLEKANDTGIRISFKEDNIIVEVQKGKMADISILNELKANKPLLINYFRNYAARNNHLLETSPVQHIGERPAGLAPLSFAQERLWFIDKMQGSVQYHLPWIFRLEGHLDITILEKAFKALLVRHEILRTVIREKEGEVYQQVMPADNWTLTLVEADEIVQIYGSVQAYLHHQIAQPYDLSNDPVLKVYVIRQSATEHQLLALLHHIAFDGGSVPVMARELTALYQSYSQGQPVDLPALPIQYADYAIWQRRSMQGEALQQKLHFWNTQLKDLATLELPTDFTRPAVQSISGDELSITLSKTLKDDLVKLSRKEGVTLYMTLLAAFKVLLYRYTAQEDICVGTPVAGRQRQEVETLIGFFVNTIPLRSQLSADEPFHTLLQRLKSVVLQGFDHQEIPFEKIVEALGLKRELNRNAVFQVMFAMQQAAGDTPLTMDGIQLYLEDHTVTTAKFDLYMNATEFEDGLRVRITYCTDLFRQETINNMLQHFEQVLRAVTANAQVKVGAITLLTPDEALALEAILAGVNTGDKVGIVTDLFEQQAAAYPDRSAVVYESSVLTYKELDERSNQVATYLVAKGVGSGILVPICIDRSLEMIIGILAILKTGAAYAPVDPAFPDDRLSYILEDLAATVILSAGEQVPRLKAFLGEHTAVEVIALDDNLAAFTQYKADRPQRNIVSSDLAYVIYTSGSTGKPKGVMVEHGQLAVYLESVVERFRLKECNSFAILASFAADGVITAMFAALCHGSVLHVLSLECITDPRLMQAYQEAHGIECYKMTPTMLEALLEYKDVHAVMPRKKLMIGGEAFTWELIHRVWPLLPEGCSILNHYGPTETTVGVVTYEFPDPQAYERNRLVPIGTPLSNVQAFILDKQLLPVPTGVAGELYIGGPLVARGYLKRQELTDERFISHTISGRTIRLYKTGDTVRYLPDGNIAYLGRTDDQIKIRGYRIEPGEIESVLREVENVKMAAVNVMEDDQHNRSLVAYLVTEGDLDKDTLAAYARKKLPEYMVPVYWIKLDAFPLTVNGKLNRKALPAVNADHVAKRPYTAPGDDTEIALAKIWQQLLNTDKVGIYDNFFSLGGHSLLVTRMIAAIRTQLKLEINIRDVFRYPEIAALAAFLKTQQEQYVLPPVSPQQRGGLIPLSFAQERLWFIDKLQGSVQYHMPWVVRVKGDPDIQALEYSFRAIIERHEVLRTVIRESDGIGYQEILSAENWQLHHLQETEIAGAGDTMEAYITRRIAQPYDLSRDWMLQVDVISCNEGDHLLLILLHHIAGDGWSVSVMIRELASIYNSYKQKIPAVLPSVNVQYADYALWQRRYLEGDVLQKQLQYWKGRLTDVVPFRLPTDFPRPAIQSVNGKAALYTLDKELTRQLQLFSQKQEVTLFMTLLSAFKVLMYRYTGQYDICVGTSLANRTQQELEHLIGFFVNALALRNHINPADSFSALLQQIRTSTLEAYDHQDAPFEKVVEAVAGGRDIGNTPIYPVMFVLQNTPETAKLDFNGLELEGYEFQHVTSKFDLTFSLRETADHIRIHVEYCSDLFEETTIRRMISHYENLLRAVIRNCEVPVGRVQFLSASERQQLLVDFNQSAVSYPEAGKTVVDLFGEQVIATPQAIAIITATAQLTYREVDERANELSRYLIEQGVGKDALVPVCIPRSVEMVIGILGVLKAGAAYVPLDPTYPADRIAYILDDTRASVVITTTAYRHQVRKGQLHIVDLQEMKTLQNEEFKQVSSSPAIKDLAYVIYTSGSTGKPKGVLIQHDSLMNYLLNCRKRYMGTTAGEGSFFHLSYTFDASLTALFLPLITGRSVVIAPAEVAAAEVFLDPLFYSRTYEFIKATPAHMGLLEYAMKGHPGITRRLVLGGEALQAGQLQYLAAEGMEMEIVNEYGPTEATVGSSVYVLNTASGQLPAVIPIGKPLDNVTMYILNELLEPSPVGIAGELCIGGVQVARGYLNHPELTAEKFINSPFREGERLYRTGDQARWLADGNVEFIGRIDEQVKIRGYRVEPGEVESVVNKLDAVKVSAIVVKEDASLMKRLVCYYVPHPQAISSRKAEFFERRVNTWKELYETTYGRAENEEKIDDEFNIVGWNDSFTGGAIPAPEMKEWLDDIRSVILSERPQHVLEIGCGTGLIYYSIAGHITKYTGTDFSAGSINSITRHISGREDRYCETTLRVCPAHEVSAMPEEGIDTIILNSVIQYFPGEDYLTGVIRNAVSSLAGKGRIIIGDVRDNRLLTLFKARLTIDKLKRTTGIREFAWRTAQETLKEEELCLSPAYFYALKTILPRISHVELRWKQGDSLNELTLYRYNVVIYVDWNKPQVTPEWQDWTGVSDQQGVISQLEQRVPVLALRHMPNVRLWKERYISEALTDKTYGTIHDLVKKMQKPDEEVAAAAGILSFAGAAGYTCHLYPDKDPLKMHIVMSLASVEGFIKQESDNVSDSEQVTNNPVFTEINALLQRRMRASLQQRLPEYMIPAEFIAVEQLPLTGNGKTDRKFLSSTEDLRTAANNGYQAPGNELEQRIADIWQELLGVEQIGVDDNFFELGGHSVLMVQLLHRFSDWHITLKDLFVHQTIKRQAELITKRGDHSEIFIQKRSVLNNHLLLLRSGKKDLPVFIVPGSTGVSDSYEELASSIKTEYQVYGIQMQGAFPQEDPLKDLETLAAKHIEWIREVQPKGPYRIIGHSFGGYVAYEMARQLEIAGEELGLLSIIDVEAASVKKNPESEEEMIDLLMLMAGRIFERYGIIERPYPRWIEELKAQLSGLQTTDNMIMAIMQFAKDRFAGKNVAIDALFQLLRLQTTNALMSRSINMMKLKASLVLVKGAAEDWSAFAHDLGWEKCFDSVEVFVVPGNHADMLQKSAGKMGTIFTEKLKTLQ